MYEKYSTAIVSSIFIFFAVFLLLGLGLAAVVPAKWFDVYINLGLLEANIPSLISGIISAIAATYTFKASLHSKTGVLYRKKSNKENDSSKNV